MKTFEAKSEMWKYVLDNNKEIYGHEGDRYFVRDVENGGNKEVYICNEEIC